MLTVSHGQCGIKVCCRDKQACWLRQDKHAEQRLQRFDVVDGQMAPAAKSAATAWKSHDIAGDETIA